MRAYLVYFNLGQPWLDKTVPLPYHYSIVSGPPRCLLCLLYATVPGGMPVHKTLSGHYLFIVFVWEGRQVKVISARDMNKSERRFYQRK